jgi:hypothetical protein
MVAILDWQNRVRSSVSKEFLKIEKRSATATKEVTKGQDYPIARCWRFVQGMKKSKMIDIELLTDEVIKKKNSSTCLNAAWLWKRIEPLNVKVQGCA